MEFQMTRVHLLLTIWFVVLTCECKFLNHHVSVTDFQICSIQPHQNVFEVLPGYGWDGLRNKPMGRLVELNYSECRITEDGKYLIPNGFIIIPTKSSALSMKADLFDHFKDYRPMTAETLIREVAKEFPAVASFSGEYTEVKDAQVLTKKAISRVGLTHKSYEAMIQRGKAMGLNHVFHQRVWELGEELMLDPITSPSFADYLAESLVQQFGTHYIFALDAGASIYRLEYVRRASYSKSCAYKFFMAMVHSREKISGCYSDGDFLHNTVLPRLYAIGGPAVGPKSPLSYWQQNLENNLVGIDQQGDYIDTLVNDELFPDFPASIVREMQLRIRNGIIRYYTKNSIKGCMDFHSQYFDNNANNDDHRMCKAAYEQFFYKGNFQTCQNNNATNKDDEPCRKWAYINHVTKRQMCPRGSSTYLLVQRPEKTCKKGCESINNRTICRDKCTFMTVRTYWCGSTRDHHPRVAFGGLLSLDTPRVNPISHNFKCSGKFDMGIFVNLFNFICSSRQSKILNKEFPARLKFGGFFSCTSGNPYSQDDPQSCPRGYSPYYMMMVNECEIHYCLSSVELSQLMKPGLRRPPFTRQSKPKRRYLGLSDFAMNEVYTRNGEHWVKESNRWTLASDITMGEIARDVDNALVKRFALPRHTKRSTTNATIVEK